MFGFAEHHILVMVGCIIRTAMFATFLVRSYCLFFLPDYSYLHFHVMFFGFFFSEDAYWGEGVYFSADASYSARSWLAAGTGGHALTGEHNIYLCKVLTGVTMKGQRNMRYLPIRQDGTMLNYDAATDANYNPTVEYVIFNDTQAYPQYRIKFKY